MYHLISRESEAELSQCPILLIAVKFIFINVVLIPITTTKEQHGLAHGFTCGRNWGMIQMTPNLHFLRPKGVSTSLRWLLRVSVLPFMSVIMLAIKWINDRRQSANITWYSCDRSLPDQKAQSRKKGPQTFARFINFSINVSAMFDNQGILLLTLEQTNLSHVLAAWSAFLALFAWSWYTAVRAQRIIGFFMLITHKSTRSENPVRWMRWLSNGRFPSCLSPLFQTES